MRLSQFHLATVKEVPADAEIASHRLMLRAGMLRKHAAGLYTWSPLGLKVLKKVETVVREEMNRAGALEVIMPTVQPRELWDETGRWQKFGAQLLKIKDRKESEYCYAPTAEEVVTDFARSELKSYKQLPVNFYQINTKFRDEIRPRFGVMRAREFLMKDAYSFHLDEDGLGREYENMYATYARIFTRLGLAFRAVNADTGAIGGSRSHEFQVLADSGEDALAFSDSSDYAANVELASYLAPGARAAAAEQMRDVPTPGKTTCADVAALLGIDITRTVKSVCVIGEQGFVLALVRGDHEVNEVKLQKIAGLAEYRLATEQEILDALGAKPGYLGPVGADRKRVHIVADRTVAAMADFVVGANKVDFHIAGVNWQRDLAEADVVADIRKVVEGDLSPDGKGTIKLARGIEVGHIFALGTKYSEAMNASVLDADGKNRPMQMGCYGIGVSRIVAAAIEQNHDEAGIVWPEPMAPWRVAVCMINPKNDAKVAEAAQALYDELNADGIDTVLDDRGLRPGAMFADIELIGIPHRIVVSERGLAAGTFEYRARRESESRQLKREEIIALLRG
ncbi:MAG: proline--tRNA ligase [Rudaea sp.]|uniref:proline--tRNA ligase n=1 Tax=unclassified Rudaea TaxID=2627037 RepID=UPI0010F45E9D|nr:MULTISPECIES: proline--tRNA ligase [unclassified Rudaea]MBN8885966.1 proline--tRNA ligase [Rudaea sp.]MBR0345073.1 proline--tRNA ligase [Rudaea sp.]